MIIVTHHLNVLNYDQWRRDVNRTVFEYQLHMVRNIRRGYDGTDENPNLNRWTIPAALMYCITIYTTIGMLFRLVLCPAERQCLSSSRDPMDRKFPPPRRRLIRRPVVWVDYCSNQLCLTKLETFLPVSLSFMNEECWQLNSVHWTLRVWAVVRSPGVGWKVAQASPSQFRRIEAINDVDLWQKKKKKVVVSMTTPLLMLPINVARRSSLWDGGKESVPTN